MKRVHIIPERRNNAIPIDIRAQYSNGFIDLLSRIEDSKIYFIDEIGFNISMRTRRGRSLVGMRAVHNVTAIRSRNISVCCAMNKNGIFKYSAQTRAYNTDSFVEFIRLLISELTILNIKDAVFIMDNVPFHKCNVIGNELLSSGHNIIYLPPYSPFLNPIENMFSKWKQLIRNLRSENEEQLFNNIENSSTFISSQDCQNYFRHMLSFLPRCIRKEPIIDE